MNLLLGFLFLVSLSANIVLAWYISKLVKNLTRGIKGVDDLQELLEEYSSLLEGMLQLDQYYGDETINGAVKNTKMVVEACKFYKKSVLDISESVDEENFETTKTG